jgi:mRNA interferase HigB
MDIINLTKLNDFARKHPKSRKALERWERITRAAVWLSFSDVKRDFPAADQYGACVIFDIGGNKYRLITKINYGVDIQIVNIREVMTHAEYDKDKWKGDCE